MGALLVCSDVTNCRAGRARQGGRLTLWNFNGGARSWRSRVGVGVGCSRSLGREVLGAVLLVPSGVRGAWGGGVSFPQGEGGGLGSRSLRVRGFGLGALLVPSGVNTSQLFIHVSSFGLDGR